LFSHPHSIKFKNSQYLFSPKDHLNRWDEHYRDLASDSPEYKLNNKYWISIIHNNQSSPITWKINKFIFYFVIRNTVLSMKGNKVPGLDGIPIEFYKALFCNKELEEGFPDEVKYLEITFTKIWEESSPND